MQLYQATLVIVVLVTLSVSVPTSATSFIENVLKKLDECANNVRPASGISKGELLGMVDEWKELPEDQKAAWMNMAKFRLLFHFGVLPTERIRDLLDDTDMANKHIHRLEKAYKRFLPGYMGLEIENGYMGNMQNKKMMAIFFKLKHHQACTLEDFKWLNIEHSSWITRFENIVTQEDVYANLDEMRNILNYHNSDLVKPLLEQVLPLLGEINDPAVLQQLYYDKLYEATKFRFDEQGYVVR